MENSIEDTVTELVLARVPPETKIVIMAVMGSRGITDIFWLFLNYFLINWFIL